jgi:hypothetical protein
MKKIPRWDLYWELINGPAAALALVMVHERFKDADYVTLLAVLLWGFALILYYKQRQLRQAERESKLHNRRDHYGMLRQSLTHIATVIKGRTKLQRELVLGLQEVRSRETTAPYVGNVLALLATEHFSEIIDQGGACQAILDTIRTQLTEDSYGQHQKDSNFFPHDFFKVTYYRREKNGKGDEVFHRFKYSSPPGWHPNPASEWLPAYRAGTMGFASNTRRIQIVEDITQEDQREAKHWRDFRAKQHDHYAALACVPVIDEFADGGVEGVITIDTNRQLYFRDTTDYKAFLGELLEPYMDYIVLMKYVGFTYREWQTIFKDHENLSIGSAAAV